MKKQLQDYARAFLLDGLKQLPEGWRCLFKRMYAPKNPNVPIEKVVAQISEGKLDWAMAQVENSIRKLRKKEASDDN